MCLSFIILFLGWAWVFLQASSFLPFLTPPLQCVKIRCSNDSDVCNKPPRFYSWRTVEATSVFETDVLFLFSFLPSFTKADRGNALALSEREREESRWHWKQKQKANWWWFNISDHLGDRAKTKGFYTFKETEMPFWFNLRESWKWWYTLPTVPGDWK